MKNKNERKTNGNFINYVFNKDKNLELIFFTSENKVLDGNEIVYYDINNSIIMKNGEFLLLFLNADFSSEELAEKTFFSKFHDISSSTLKSYNSTNELHEFQNKLKKAVNFIFEYKTYTNSYETNFKDFIVNANKIESICEGKRDIFVLFDTKINEINSIYDKVNNTILKDFGYIQDVYCFTTIIQLLYIMLKQFTIFNSLPIRACKNCNRFFMAQNRKDELYCNNLFRNTGKTCKELGAMSTYIQKLESNPVLALYKNMQKRKYMRVKRNPDNKELEVDFNKWKELSKSKFEQYKNNKITSEEFEKWLYENE